MQQCACDDTTQNETLAQLRAKLIARLGFADPLGNAPTRQLVDLRTDMLRLLGYGAVVDTPPPGIAEELDVWLNEAQQTAFRRLELDQGNATPPARMTADSDTTTLDYQPVLNLALAMACQHRAKPEAKAYFDSYERYVGDVAARRPPGLVALLNQLLIEAQATTFDRLGKAGVRTERWFSWDLTAGERFYDLDGNAEQTADPACTKLLDPSLITFVGVQRDTSIQRLTAGIPPYLLAYTTTGWPERYEVRQCIELWPAPAATEGQLIIKGHFQPSAFAADADKTTIKSHVVYLLALANAKAHYKQPDAQSVMAQFEGELRSIVAGSHQTYRYLPGVRRTAATYVEPKPDVPFA